MGLKKLILWGATGQSIMIEEILSEKHQLIALFDNNTEIKSPFTDIPIYYGWEGFNKWKVSNNLSEYYFMVAIGGENGRARVELHEKLKNKGLLPITAIHSSAYVSPNSDLDDGAQVMPNASICPRVKIGLSVIINTSASVDHECFIGDGVHIGPGAKLAGCVEIGDYSFIGTNATILPNIKIGKNVTIGAGAVVTKNIENNVVAYGNPCRVVKKLN